MRIALKLLMIAASLGIIAGIAVITAVTWVFWTYGRDLPDYRQLAEYTPPVVTRVHAGNGALLAEYATEKRVFVPVEAIPEPVIQAFLSAEDKDFYEHFGIDLRALFRAVLTNIIQYGSGRRPIGASTITQQVAKNFLLSNELSFRRKIREAILAIRMERAFTKNQLLGLYLNEIYLGLGSYGVAAAALNYFDRSLDQLTLAEIAYLAALPKAPNNYHPVRRYDAAIARRNWVLGQMYENGHISQNAMQQAMQEELEIRPRSGFDAAQAPFFTEEVRRQLADRFGSEALYTAGFSVRTSLDPGLQSIADRALVMGLEALDKRQGWRGPLGRLEEAEDDIGLALSRWQDTMPENRFPALVVAVRDDGASVLVKQGGTGGTGITPGFVPFSLANWAYPPRDEQGVRPPPVTSMRQVVRIGDVIIVQRPDTVPDRIAKMPPSAPPLTDDSWALGQIPLVEGALVALDPHTGRVLAMTGGYNPNISEFNRATQAQRQPGSSIKPFVYLAALDAGFSPTTRILDAPLVIDQGPGLPKWKPANYTRKFYGPSIMRQGIEQSRNLMTARLALRLGMPVVQEYARRFGIDKDMPPLLSMSLGAGETTLLQLTAAYGMIVNGGAYIEPSLIDRIQNRWGETIARHDKRVCAGCAISADLVAALTPRRQPVKQSSRADAEQVAPLPPLLEDTRPKVTDPASAYQMVTMLEGAVRRGTGRGIGDVGFAIAGKTGTTNENTNAWFIGFTPDLVAGVWVGYDLPRPLGKRETGSSAAVPIFKDFISAVMATADLQTGPEKSKAKQAAVSARKQQRIRSYQAGLPFRRPDGVTLIPVNPFTGLRAAPGDSQQVLEAFKPGQRPPDPRQAGMAGDAEVIDIPADFQQTGTGSQPVGNRRAAFGNRLEDVLRADPGLPAADPGLSETIQAGTDDLRSRGNIGRIPADLSTRPAAIPLPGLY